MGLRTGAQRRWRRRRGREEGGERGRTTYPNREGALLKTWNVSKNYILRLVLLHCICQGYLHDNDEKEGRRGGGEEERRRGGEEERGGGGRREARETMEMMETMQYP